MRNTLKYTGLYSGGTPTFEEGDTFVTVVPLSRAATELRVGPQAAAPGDKAGAGERKQVDIGVIVEFCSEPRSRREIQDFCGYSSAVHFRRKILGPLLESGQHVVGGDAAAAYERVPHAPPFLLRGASSPAIVGNDLWARRQAGPPSGGGGTPAIFVSKGATAVGGTLSVFCDESGDIGSVSPHAPYYIVTLVLHDQAHGIGEAVTALARAMNLDGLPGDEVIHTAPLVRREPPYRDRDLRVRRRIFSHLEHFMRHCDIKTRSFVIDKRVHGSGDALIERLAREMGQFVSENLALFQSFDRVIVYYDQGQKEVSRTLRTIFGAALFGSEFRTVSPTDYRLFQVADLVCALELVARKASEGRLSASELRFFGDERALRRNHLRQLAKTRV